MKKYMFQPIHLVFLTVFLDVIGFGIIIPVLPTLLAEMNNIGINEASTYGGFLLASFALAQFVFSPIMGNLSDQYGRRPIILAALFGFSIDYLVLAFAPNYAWLVAGRIFAGICGSSYTAASAYIADVSTEDNRAQNYGILGAAFGLGFIIGPLIGGFFGEFGVRVPFYVAAGLTMMNLIGGYFLLPESLDPAQRRRFEWKRANPMGTLRQLAGYPSIGLLLITYFLLHLGTHAVNSNWSYFTMFHLGWSEGMVGVSLGYAGLLFGTFQAVFAQRVSNKYGYAKGISFGIALYCVSMLLFSMASSTWMMFAILIPYCVGSIGMPISQSYLASKVTSSEQGELQGGLTSIQSLTTIFGPLIMTNIFFFTTSDNAPLYLPGSPFLLAAFLMLLSLLIALHVFTKEEITIAPDKEPPS